MKILEKGMVALGIIYQKVLLVNITSISMKKTVWPIDWFWFKMIKKLESWQKGKMKAIPQMFVSYEYIKNHYRLIAVDLSRQKE